MSGVLISVVLPIYNVEMYLERCIKSIVNQTYKNLEIILIDDGSPDNCPQICEEWARKDSRVKVIHKKNAGLGMARNTGIENATGRYICFVDSDDYIALDTIEKAYNQARKVSADIVYYGHKEVDKTGKIIKEYIPQIKKLWYLNEEIREIIIPELISPDFSSVQQTNLMMSACTALFSMAVIKRTQWKFVSEREIIAEDVYSLLKLFENVNCVAIVPEALYYYCNNSTSLTRTYRVNRYQGIKTFYDKCIVMCNEIDYPPIVKSRLASAYLAFVIAALKMIVLSVDTLYTKLQNINHIVNDPHLNQTLRNVDLKIESKSRKLIWRLLIKKKTLLCYCILLARCKLKE